MLRSKIFFTILIISFLSCHSFKQIEGRYCIQRKYLPADNITLILNSDKTFEGTSWSDIAGNFIVSGTWNIIDDTLYFKTKPLGLIDTIIYMPKKIIPTLSDIQFLDIEKGIPIEGVHVINGNENYFADKDGYVSIDSIRQDFLNIEYIGLKDSIHKKEIRIGENRVFFNFKKLQTFSISHKWLIKKRKIFPLEKGYSVFRKCN